MPPNARILIVDDHEDTLYALESALAPLGHLLGRATSGDEALKQLLRGNVGLLLLDVRPPGTGGLDVVRYMRRLEQTQLIPVVLLTGFTRDPQLGAAAYALGVADLVTPPVDPWALRTKIRHLYDTHQRRLALEREVRALRARLGERTGTPGHPGAPGHPALPHPHAHVPPGGPAGAHTGELERDRT
ncbi:two-component system response regulator [Streptomyces sp. NPDC012403]|uniref:response regulator n=1 Tax=unclassified Streptomyces TaxID=2593676 RepID=UPI001C2425E4|nr:response regulator [Streptomyces sp. AC558_RSS880]